MPKANWFVNYWRVSGQTWRERLLLADCLGPDGDTGEMWKWVWSTHPEWDAKVEKLVAEVSVYLFDAPADTGAQDRFKAVCKKLEESVMWIARQYRAHIETSGCREGGVA
ncbi:MAG: hypothetical protein HZA22_04555 [Nitrospirae bacterium]|nr:hypothetical protein [Nitrospirota bacterium]